MTTRKPYPSREHLLQLFDYDPTAQTLLWKNPTNTRIRKGSVAGNYDARSHYHRIQLHGTSYSFNRIVQIIAAPASTETFTLPTGLTCNL